MASKQSGKANLSKHLLQMKFMQRSALRVQKEEYEQEKFIDDEHWKRDIPEMAQKRSKFVLEPSYVHCEEFIFSRVSLKGFNPEIEKLMQAHDKELSLARALERENEMSVNDEEMAARYSSLVGTIAKRFKKRRHRKEVDSEEEGELSEPIENIKKNRFCDVSKNVNAKRKQSYHVKHKGNIKTK